MGFGAWHAGEGLPSKLCVPGGAWFTEASDPREHALVGREGKEPVVGVAGQQWHEANVLEGLDPRESDQQHLETDGRACGTRGACAKHAGGLGGREAHG